MNCKMLFGLAIGMVAGAMLVECCPEVKKALDKGKKFVKKKMVDLS